jgi:ATP-dependent Zn protease
MQAWVNFIVSWFPFLLLIGFWIYFMKKMKASRQPQLTERTFEHMDRVEALLERIVKAVEDKGGR